MPRNSDGRYHGRRSTCGCSIGLREMTRVAIITGASSGMGAEFCRRLDAYNLDSIWLIARRKDKLDEVASSLKTPTKIITTDLTDPSQIASVKEIIDSEKPDIGYLVNCAGFGKFGMTWELSPELTKSMIDILKRYCRRWIISRSITYSCSPRMWIPISTVLSRSSARSPTTDSQERIIWPSISNCL